MRKYHNPYRITSIADQHQLLQLPEPKHPLISITNLENTKELPRHIAARFSLGFYAIAITRHFTCDMQYGQEQFDFRKGVLSFVAPDQLLSWASGTPEKSLGWLVSIHPDFLRENMPGLKMKEFDFFSYAGNEALYLSQQEESMVMSLIENIKKEYSSIEDTYSQRIIISYIWLLLQYADRAYHRQSFATNNPSPGLVAKIDTILSAYIDGNLIAEKGLPTVQYLSNRLNFSPNYLNEAVKKNTGKTVQQIIQDKLIEKAKDLLSLTELSVSEISYRLGFAYPQSFSKFFNKKTNTYPTAYRGSFLAR